MYEGELAVFIMNRYKKSHSKVAFSLSNFIWKLEVCRAWSTWEWDNVTYVAHTSHVRH